MLTLFNSCKLSYESCLVNLTVDMPSPEDLRGLRSCSRNAGKFSVEPWSSPNSDLISLKYSLEKKICYMTWWIYRKTCYLRSSLSERRSLFQVCTKLLSDFLQVAAGCISKISTLRTTSLLMPQYSPQQYFFQEQFCYLHEEQTTQEHPKTRV